MPDWDLNLWLPHCNPPSTPLTSAEGNTTSRLIYFIGTEQNSVQSLCFACGHLWLDCCFVTFRSEYLDFWRERKQECLTSHYKSSLRCSRYQQFISWTVLGKLKTWVQGWGCEQEETFISSLHASLVAYILFLQLCYLLEHVSNQGDWRLWGGDWIEIWSSNNINRLVKHNCLAGCSSWERLF